MNVCSKLIGVEQLASQLELLSCARGVAGDHSQIIPGIAYFTPAVIHNWRVLWYSLPSSTRQERLLKGFRASLEQHRQKELANGIEQWRMEYKFLGIPVCKVAFVALTGISTYMLTHCREGAIRGQRSVLSVHEMGLYASIRNHQRAGTYLSARQWLEQYAGTHAEMSPMDEKAYLPSGRKTYYYYHYRQDMIARSETALEGQGTPRMVSIPEESIPEEEPVLGSTLGQCSGARPASLSAAQRGRKRKSLGSDPALGSTPRRGGQMCQTHGSAARAGIVMASLSTFLEAWRVECPWIVVAKSLSMFTRCSVCDYLKLLIEQCPREEHELREFLKDRLGQHFDFQAAQRLAHGRVEEEAAQSGGDHWCTLIDKMDQRKTVVPSIWSQLGTPLFKEVDRRLVTGLIGTMWFGTTQTSHHVRTVFDDCQHGAEMQSSTLLLNLHQVAMEEGHLPKRWTIGADNTRKETKNQTTMWMLVWLLCALVDTPLWMIDVIFLLVGHTHNKLDRFFLDFPWPWQAAITSPLWAC